MTIRRRSEGNGARREISSVRFGDQALVDCCIHRLGDGDGSSLELHVAAGADDGVLRFEVEFGREARTCY